MPIQLYWACRSCEGNTDIAAENNRYEQEKDCDHVLTDNKRQTLDKSTAIAPRFSSSSPVYNCYAMYLYAIDQ